MKSLIARLPVNAIVMQTVYYSIVAVYGSYLVLYFGDIGFTATQIGLITSVSTFAVLLTQPLWGFASDRAKDGRTVLSLLFIMCGLFIFSYYLTKEFLFVLVIATVFAVFYNPIVPIMDSLTLESLERAGGRYDYGTVRVGGTVGYSIMVIIAGWLLNGAYSRMFYIAAIFFFISLVLVRRASAVKIRGGRSRVSFRALLANKKVLCFMFVNLINAFGQTGFYQFYPLHFTAHVGNSEWFGVLLFVTAMSELPFWFVAGKLIKRYGYERMMLIAITTVGVRWLILYFLTNIPLLLIVNLSHGFCFVTIQYSLVTYLNENIPKELRATGQTMNNLAAMVFSRVIGGVIFGLIGDYFGIDSMFIFLAALSFAGAVTFFVWLGILNRKERAII